MLVPSLNVNWCPFRLQTSKDYCMRRMLDSCPPCGGPLYPLKICVNSEWMNKPYWQCASGSWKWTPATVSSLRLPATDWLIHRRSPCVGRTWAEDWQLITQHWTILPERIERGTLIITDPYLLSTGDSFLIFCGLYHSLCPLFLPLCPASLCCSHICCLRNFWSILFFISSRD